jgi:SulP family sulfate permease
MRSDLVPKLFTCLRSYDRQTWRSDLLAGITIGIISIPLAIAFAIASGATPERGLITACVAGFLISALGGSRVQIGGPTGAFVVLIYSILERSGYEGLALATLMAGGLLVLFGLLRLGKWMQYIPHTLIVGFTAGLGLLIFSSQIGEFFGLSLVSCPPAFVEKWSCYIAAFPSTQLPTVCVGLGSLLLIILIERYLPRIPWGIVTLGVATLLVYLFDIPVATVHNRFGELPQSVLQFSCPAWSFTPQLAADALAIAFLCAIESLLCARISDRMMGGSHRANCELVGQGVANCASILCGGIPATAALARTATNVKAGAKTPLAGIIHALTILLFVLFFAPLIGCLPLSALSAVLIMVAWHMSDMPQVYRLLRTEPSAAPVLLTSLLATLLLDITSAILLGMLVHVVQHKWLSRPAQ